MPRPNAMPAVHGAALLVLVYVVCEVVTAALEPLAKLDLFGFATLDADGDVGVPELGVADGHGFCLGELFAGIGAAKKREIGVV